MNISYIHNDNKPRLVLIFAGWGMNTRPFAALSTPGYDLAVVWGYDDTAFDYAVLAPYCEIVVIAWSMGVMMADRILSGSFDDRAQLPVTLTIAVNGTPLPVDDTRGIPQRVFDGTLQGLSEASVAKFNLRMAGSRQAYEQFKAIDPARPVDDLAAELKFLGDAARQGIGGSINWDVAIIGERDMIFPPANMETAWATAAVGRVVKSDEAHWPDFQRIIDRFVVNKERVEETFGQSRQGYEQQAELQHDVARRLCDLLAESTSRRTFDRVVEIGAGSGRLTSLYTPLVACRDLELWDLAPMPVVPPGAKAVVGDAELGEIAPADLIITSSTLQWFNSPVKGVAKMCRLLKQDGIAAMAFYVDGTYRSLAQATGVSINYASPGEAIKVASQWGEVVVAETESRTVEFPSTRALFEHLRSTGVNAAGQVSTAIMRRLLEANELRSLEYEILYLIVR